MILNEKNSNHSDYCWVDYAPDGVKSRNNMVKPDSIVLPEDPIGVYRSIFRFSEDFAHHVKDTGSVSKSEKFLAYADELIFDIDNGDLNTALESTRSLMARLRDTYGVSADQVSIWFSGKKGFHVGIPAELIGWEPATDIHVIAKTMAKEIAGDIPIDLKIYDKTRLLRMEGSIHQDSGLYKVRLDPLWFIASADIELITDKAKGNDQWVPATETEMSLNQMLHELYVGCKAKKGGKKVLTRPCIEKLLLGSVDGVRDEAAIRLASHFRSEGLSREEAEIRLMLWNDLNSPPMQESEITRKVQSAYENDYKYSCKDVLLKSNCSTDCPLLKKTLPEKENIQRVSFKTLSDGTKVETLYDPSKRPQTFLALFQDNEIEYVENYLDPKTGEMLYPLEAESTLENKVVLLPSAVEEYSSLDSLFDEVSRQIRTNVSLPEKHVYLLALYVMASWKYDSFRTFPYIHIVGAYGTGKSRLLQVVGRLCYRSIKASTSSSIAWVFRTIAKHKGTLVLDEADFSDSTNSSPIVQMLNSGNEKGGTVDRCGKDFDETQSFSVYGPKILSGRFAWDEEALESRCLNIEMDSIADSSNFSYNLAADFEETCVPILNKLMCFRLSQGQGVKAETDLKSLMLEPRLAQILQPLYAIVALMSNHNELDSKLNGLALELNEEMKNQRYSSEEGRVFTALYEIWKSKPKTQVTMKDIAIVLREKQGNRFESLIENKIGKIVRKSFGLEVKRSKNGVYVVRTDENNQRLQKLASRYSYPMEE